TTIALGAAGPRPRALRVLVDSSDLSLTGYFLELHETTAGSHAFVSDGGVPVMLPSAPPTSTRVVAVDEHEGTDAGRFEPVWVVASGLRTASAADRGHIDGDAFELTADPVPAPEQGFASLAAA